MGSSTSGKRHSPTDDLRRQVKSLAALGVPQRQIAPFVGISLPTLTKYYREELHAGKWEANAQVAKSLFQKATGGNVTACIFWLKSQAGWRDQERGEVVADAGGLTIKFAKKGDDTDEDNR